MVLADKKKMISIFYQYRPMRNILVSVLADKKKMISIFYQYCPIRNILVSVSANKKKMILIFYQYQLIRKLNVLAFIGIHRYEKSLFALRPTTPFQKNWICTFEPNIEMSPVCTHCAQLQKKIDKENSEQHPLCHQDLQPEGTKVEVA